MTDRRHNWGAPSRPSETRTTRICKRCGMQKITRHDGGPCAIPWLEFVKDGLLVGGVGTPPCVPTELGVVA